MPSCSTLVQRNGAQYLAELVIVLARARFVAIDGLARAIGASTAELFQKRVKVFPCFFVGRLRPRRGCSCRGLVMVPFSPLDMGFGGTADA